MVTTIQIDNKIKAKLDSLKVHHRETYNELISRLISKNIPVNEDREDLIDTIEILSDSKLMKELAESLERIDKGDYGTPLEELEKELEL